MHPISFRDTPTSTDVVVHYAVYSPARRRYVSLAQQKALHHEFTTDAAKIRKYAKLADAIELLLHVLSADPSGDGDPDAHLALVKSQITVHHADSFHAVGALLKHDLEMYNSMKDDNYEAWSDQKWSSFTKLRNRLRTHNLIN